MADTKISGLPAVTALTTGDEFPVNDGGVSRKTTAGQIREFNGYPGFYYRRAAGAAYSVPAFASGSSSTAGYALNVEYAQPVWVTKVGGLAITGVSVNVGTAVTSASVRIGLRADDGSGMPGTLLVDWTSAAALAAATTGIKTQTVTYTLPEGLSWVTLKSDVAAASLTGIIAHHPIIQKFGWSIGTVACYTAPAGAAGALPSAAPAWNGTNTQPPNIGFTLA